MKNLFLFAFLFSACASSTSVNPADEWNIGVYKGHVKGLPTTMRLKTSLGDSVVGTYNFDTDTLRQFWGTIMKFYNNGILEHKEVRGECFITTYPEFFGSNYTMNQDTIFEYAPDIDTLIKQ